jgi:hypothetical protein
VSRKQLPPPDGGNDLAQALAARLHTDPAPAAPPPPSARPAAAPPATRAPRLAAPRKADPSRPSARDLAAPSRPSIAREALKADVPAELTLLQRLHRYRLDKGVDIRDQVAIAVDEWLTSQGY